MSVYGSVYVYSSTFKSLPANQPVGNESLLVALALTGLAVVIGFVPEAISDRSWRWQQVMKFVSGSHHVPEESATKCPLGAGAMSICIPDTKLHCGVVAAGRMCCCHTAVFCKLLEGGYMSDLEGKCFRSRSTQPGSERKRVYISV